jgi:hypothetical protein
MGEFNFYFTFSGAFRDGATGKGKSKSKSF